MAPVVRFEAGLADALDDAAMRAAEGHRFLRRAWYAAALQAYGGTARTLGVEEAGVPVAALPLVAKGPGWLGLAEIPGCYWPFRSFPVVEGASAAAADALLGALARRVRALRIGPVYDCDLALDWLKARALAAGWTLLDRHVADSFLLDIASEDWPRGSTLRKNRHLEKHLASTGTLAWEWGPPDVDTLAEIERHSWIAERTDGRDAKFTAEGHGAFWKAALHDPVLADMLSAAMLRIDGRPMAFSFDLVTGARCYAIANSYDPAVAKHSPGKLLQYRNLLRARERGVRLVDWGAGDSGYKQTMGATAGPAIRDWIFVRPGLEALAARLLRGAWRRSGQAAGGQA
ncbi:GNAT family N-acetyltransferase [Sphingomonas sp. ABOLD]|uniref:CelD/BcsL family acetyltransferase involved in cellulose biosynthesis n=1 Tax=Sphingomonas trueperi TaxID=53317 RepID=A0A7X5XZI8_9SPHN|nr:MULTISPECIES: GNAT family N-acetyltransferase [Sphingomonas]NJB98276.1 CelD/BcsL family acetyltransferase involved in cellulose biosynthesis [Sphingomonas trueperi]RSV41329.1 GNAT family N-acetyltransferase [Sphingomonas sp. ABOLD]